jgi:hypothetical protein
VLTDAGLAVVVGAAVVVVEAAVETGGAAVSGSVELHDDARQMAATAPHKTTERCLTSPL